MTNFAKTREWQSAYRLLQKCDERQRLLKSFLTLSSVQPKTRHQAGPHKPHSLIFYSRVMKSFSDIEATVEATMMVATAKRPTT
jgi:hypothetical protein